MTNTLKYRLNHVFYLSYTDFNKIEFVVYVNILYYIELAFAKH